MKEMSDKVICPFCKETVTEEDKETEVRYRMGTCRVTYVCYKKICRNQERHYGHGDIVIPYAHDYRYEETKEKTK